MFSRLRRRILRAGDHALVLVALGMLATAARSFGQAASPTVFVEHYHPDGNVASFTVNPDGSVDFVGASPSGAWTDPVAASPDGRFLAAANAEDADFQELRVFRVNADGSLSQLLLDLVPTTPLDVKWLDNQTLAATETNVTISSVHTYRWDEEALTLTHLDEESSGVFNSSLVRHPRLPYLYANDASGSSAVRRYRINRDGTLAYEETTSTGTVYPLDLAIAGNGKWLYAGGGISAGGHAVLGFAVDADDGSLTALPGSPFYSPGQSPAYLTLARDDEFLFVGHGTDATVRSFAVNADGSLTSLGYSFDVGLQGTIGDLAAIGNVLFVTDDSTAIDGISGLYSFTVNADGSFSMIGGINDTFAVRPTKIATWSPAPLIGDLDGDGDVDLDDFALFAQCFAGADNPPAAGCAPGVDADLDGDGDVDLSDFAIFGQNFTGAM